jgi:K(+)-stimulated pyrophosphate-energized sodium pump
MIWILPVSIGLGFITFYYWTNINKTQSDTEPSSISEMMGYIHECANIFLKQQYSLILKILFLISGLMFAGSYLGHFDHFFGLVIFTGGLWGGVIGYFGLKFSISSVEKLITKMKESTETGSRYLMMTGSVLVTICVSVVLADMCLWMFTLNWIFDHNVFGLSQTILHKIEFNHAWSPDIVALPEFIHLKFEAISLILISYAIGTSIQAMISRVGGGIFRTATHLGAENAFTEAQINLPEDDIRNPGVLADLVGRNISGVSGSLSGLIQMMAISLAISTYLATYLIEMMPNTYHSNLFIFPHILLGIGLISQLVGFWSLFFWKKPTVSIMYKGQLTAAVINLLAILLLIAFNIVPFRFGLAAIIGVIGAHCIFFSLSTRTNYSRKPVNAVSVSAQSGLASTLLSGLEKGISCAGIPIIITALVLAGSHYVGNGFENLSSGIYAIGISAIASIGSSFFLRGIACSQPIASTGVSLARMLQDDTTTQSLLEQEAIMTSATTGADSSFGLALFLNATTSIVVIMISIKHWIHKLAGESVIQLGNVYFSNHPIDTRPDAILIPELHIFDLADRIGINLVNPQLLVGLVVGLTTIILITYLCVRHITTLSSHLSLKIRKEFVENPDIAKGLVLPKYEDNISFSTSYSDKAVLAPFLLGCGSIILVSLFFGIPGTIGYILGALISIFTINFLVGNSSIFWKNARVTTKNKPHLRILSNVFSIIPDCVQPVLNTVMILMLSLSVLLGVIALKFGHILVL